MSIVLSLSWPVTVGFLGHLWAVFALLLLLKTFLITPPAQCPPARDLGSSVYGLVEKRIHLCLCSQIHEISNGVSEHFDLNIDLIPVLSIVTVLSHVQLF